MNKLLILAAASLVLFSAACAPATPTVDPAQIQASAVAAASTMVAMTQEALPTATEVPPTPMPSPTPLPSPTLVTLPTLAFGGPPTAAPAPTNSGDACNAPMSSETDGPLASVRIINATSGDVVLSLYLNKTVFGECGYRGFNLSPNGSLTVNDLPQGCYFAGAFVNSGKKQTKAFGNGCIGSDKGTVRIDAEIISITQN